MKEGDVFENRFVVNELIFDGFRNTFRDENPLHTNDSFAKSKGFESAVMYGNILNGFLSYLIGECLPVKNVIIHSQTIKYSLPVYLNDTVLLSAKLTGVFESVNSFEFKYTFTNVKNQNIASGKFQIGLI